MDYRTRKREPQVNQRVRALRKGENMAEALLWVELKGRKLGGYKFVRQMPIGPYFADFLCRDKRLVVEVDGSQHSESTYDARRDDFMRSHGYCILRLWNTAVLKERESVCRTILAALEGEFGCDVRTSEFSYLAAAARGGTPLRFASLTTSPHRGEEDGRA